MKPYSIIIKHVKDIAYRPMPEKPEREIMGEIQAIIRQVCFALKI